MTRKLNLQKVLMICLLSIVFPSVALAIDPDAYENDDTFNQAKHFNVNAEPKNYNFHKSGDRDWLKFYAAAGKYYTITATNAGDKCDLVLQVYGKDGITPLGPAKDSSGAGKGKKETITFPPNSEGVYYIEIYDLNNTFGDGTEYDVAITKVAGDSGLIAGDIRNKCSNIKISEVVTVSIKLGSINFDPIPESDGTYAISLEPDYTFIITFEAIGYEKYSEEIRLSPGEKKLDHHVSLTPSVKNTYYQDADGDGYGNKNVMKQEACQPAGYVINNEDCDDTDAGIHPGAAEICDNKDNNCAEGADEGLPLYTYYRDMDGDGYGNPNFSTQICSPTPPIGYVTNSGDCNNDSDAGIHPGVTEICDGTDNNCDGRIDEDFPDTINVSGSIINECSGAKISNVQMTLIGNGSSNTNNVNGDYSVSFVRNTPYTITFKAEGYQTLQYQYTFRDCDNLQINITLSPLIKNTYYRDADGDGYGNPNDTIRACSPPPGYVENNGDCNDNDLYNKGSYSGSIVDKCSKQKISGVRITVSGNGKTETVNSDTGDYSLPFVPNTDYTVTLEAAGYETLPIPNVRVTFCQQIPGTNIELTPIVNLSDVISILRILTGINTAQPPICFKNQKIEMWHVIYLLQRVAGLR